MPEPLSTTIENDDEPMPFCKPIHAARAVTVARMWG